MVPSNALQRTFHLKYGTNSGTCFTIDRDSRQYLVTARHVVQGAAERFTIQIFHDGQWKDLSCYYVGATSGDVDIAVLAPACQISPTYSFEPSTNGMLLSQDAYFLGFPYGLQADVGHLNAQFPLPLVKKACISLLALDSGSDKYFLLDGHNNPGFSGGPVVFSPPSSPRKICVAGVVSSYRFEWEKVFLNGKETPLEIRYNTGIVVAYSIEYAIDLINVNPIGAQLPAPVS
ncbi:MAG: S1 family peptidase [Candidatus Loosdrechtia sp.]|uniref:S1 family peptidase n=1 Tax=Candidatus Loosdrechtia sp. TaxID=3101272 RepID=UPI003A68307F|nr:MAG: serine protease [Candidatus Jettenia sp. AMX2]